jgi:hypothetical protein
MEVIGVGMGSAEEFTKVTATFIDQAAQRVGWSENKEIMRIGFSSTWSSIVKHADVSADGRRHFTAANKRSACDHGGNLQNVTTYSTAGSAGTYSRRRKLFVPVYLKKYKIVRLVEQHDFGLWRPWTWIFHGAHGRSERTRKFSIKEPSL